MPAAQRRARRGSSQQDGSYERPSVLDRPDAGDTLATWCQGHWKEETRPGAPHALATIMRAVDFWTRKAGSPPTRSRNCAARATEAGRTAGWRTLCPAARRAAPARSAVRGRSSLPNCPQPDGWGSCAGGPAAIGPGAVDARATTVAGVHRIELSPVPDSAEGHREPWNPLRPRVGLRLYAGTSQCDQALRAAARWASSAHRVPGPGGGRRPDRFRRPSASRHRHPPRPWSPRRRRPPGDSHLPVAPPGQRQPSAGQREAHRTRGRTSR